MAETSTVDGQPSQLATRKAGLAALSDFLPRAGLAYAQSRNYDYGPATRANVARLSPYLRHRLITEAEVATAVLQHHNLQSSEKFIQEVCWRTYWKGWLEHHPDLWQAYRAAVVTDHAELADDASRADAYVKATNGQTGIACFDAWTQELTNTGYLHNHARMWFASIWIFTLRLPWTLGADFFYRHLLDGDPASNTLSWRWVAGLHTKGKTYLARANNIATFTDGRFMDTSGLATHAEAPDDNFPDFVKQKLPDRKHLSHDATAILLLHEDDLHAESWPIPPIEVAAVVTLSGLMAASAAKLQLADNVATFKTAAVEDGLAGASSAFGCTAQTIPETQIAPAAAALADFAASAGANAIVTCHAPVGPACDILDAMDDALPDGAPDIVRLRRNWDHAFWPHAKAGFFKLKEKIPSVLNDLQIVRL